MKIRKVLPFLALSAASLTPASALEINGGTDWSGWTYEGSNMSDTPFIYANGPSDFEDLLIYTRKFFLDAADTVAAGLDGNTPAQLRQGSFMNGDAIFAVGYEVTDQQFVDLDAVFLKLSFFEAPATGSFSLASPDRSTKGSLAENAGDISIRFGGGDRTAPTNYSIFTSPSTVTTPYGAGVLSLDAPVRGYGIYSDPDGAGPIAPSMKSAQLLFNYSAFERNREGANGSADATLDVGLFFGGNNYQLALLDQVAVPEPSTLALAAFGALVLFFGVRRKSAVAR